MPARSAEKGDLMETARQRPKHSAPVRNLVNFAMRAPLLSRERERELALRWRDQRDVDAMHELVESHARLAISIAKRFRNYNIPLSDLIQEAHIGLVQAADRFDPDRGVRFSTCASWWVRAAVQDYVLRNWSVVRTSTTAAQKSLFFGLSRYRARLAEYGDAELTPEHRGIVAQSLGVTEAEVERMEHRLGAAGDTSLHQALYEDGAEERQDTVVDEREGPEAEAVDRVDRKKRIGWVRQALRTLTLRERRIVRARHLAQSPKTLEELGTELGVSKERVRQIEHQAISKLRRKVIAFQELSAAAA